MRLTIIRHGETEENTTQILQGQCQNSLSRNGMLQAQALAERLATEYVEVLYSSDLKRARQTAEQIAVTLNVPIVFQPELRERNYGEFQGQSVKAYNRAMSESGLGHLTFCPIDGESYDDLEHRVISFLKLMHVRHQNQNVMLISHSGPIKILLRVLLEERFPKLFPIEQRNGCLNIIDCSTPDSAEPLVLNCIMHLSDAGLIGLGMYE